MDALTAKLWTVGGQPNVSLFDVGFTAAGIDEGWEGCGKGVNGTQHDAKGNPVINSKFPNIDEHACKCANCPSQISQHWCSNRPLHHVTMIDMWPKCENQCTEDQNALI